MLEAAGHLLCKVHGIAHRAAIATGNDLFIRLERTNHHVPGVPDGINIMFVADKSLQGLQGIIQVFFDSHIYNEIRLEIYQFKEAVAVF